MDEKLVFCNGYNNPTRIWIFTKKFVMHTGRVALYKDLNFFNFINKMCIYNVYEPVWHASLWNKCFYDLFPILLILYM
jgi:hypothetical protein